jgi:hypothetical protein
VANVKGSAMASRVLWVGLGHGAAGEAALRDAVSPELREALDRGFAKATWYPFDQFIELNVAIDRLFGRGDLSLVKMLGRYSADANLTTIYRLFFKLGNPSWILSRALRLYSAHYDTGWAEVSTRGGTSAILRVRGVERPHRAHCLSLAGWAERSIELSGGKDTRCIEAKCRTNGDDYCQLDITWR